uniref:Cytochrome b5 domain-containing protein 1 n=1 Tax=Neobodo designis TaxID=312471 RepID=A0A7S1M8Y6_NEODS|eukprot:CAMPEP_0174850770 /NCGR_PEP_ID=MMETSP1114-20130205/21133_1 /TAXON_ID=312471 /ORGANISM="Neobodo designis, Strain CCAP 1951/1" /LENGTH=222 /DNA_ID=CAMNT_0016085257 /DNA_START=27 /DNA_END=695 /DNA_ORIENTATION=+
MSSSNAPSKRFFTANEVREHCSEDDAWVSARGKVLDLTGLIAKYRGTLTQPLVRVAGSDISHWFDANTGDLKKCVDDETGLETYAQPFGRFVHVPTLRADTTVDATYELPWWMDPTFVIGELTKKSRKVRIINTLNGHETMLEVCSEETLQEILNRYLAINAHAASYTWKRIDTETRVLDMAKTLDENGIGDESDEFEALGLPADFYIPAVHLYFNDDLTVG